MLAAARPVERNDLNLFFMALSMVAAGNKNVPEPLKNYVVRIMDEARRVAKDIRSANASVLPEAISLATDLAAERELLESADKVDRFESISPEIASKFLVRAEGLDARY